MFRKMTIWQSTRNTGFVSNVVLHEQHHTVNIWNSCFNYIHHDDVSLNTPALVGHPSECAVTGTIGRDALLEVWE